ncbi:ATP-binding protein [Paraburkholderia acidisoli]|uniref:AAA domain-containing protein n=1 Tax=Paraburkholderia acidisoli TaxID=2571748 RepID=A0A7Z2GMN1_9BURK|nr:ATP-binding protein [Paraburkholderia acidisoli]QGZ64204.1 AAA domain-containing protein [Paraburkholderia acidisoli]
MTNAAATRPALPLAFPFTALVGQAELQRALLLAAIDPALGGVLVCGPRGTAKSTAARALAALLPHGAFVTLPLGASEEKLIGTLDLEAALRESAVRFAPGLLARAHEGVLYVDEVNLLPDALVDVLLDAAASGINTVERDGVSHTHDARFVLVGTMNPEEGELRPQLLDRFGLLVELATPRDAAERQRIVKARLAFDADPQALCAAFEAQQRALAQRIVAARAALPALPWSDAVHERVAQRCIEAAVDGMRADLVMLRAARALAAYEGAPAVSPEHVDAVAESVLAHRRHAAPEASRRHDQPNANHQDTESNSSADKNEQGGQNDQRDWGELAPEPVAATSVKGVIPLPAKKR